MPKSGRKADVLCKNPKNFYSFQSSLIAQLVKCLGLCFTAMALGSIPGNFTFFFNWEKRSYDPRAQKTVIWLQGWKDFPWSTKYWPCCSQMLFTITSQYFTKMQNIKLTHDVFYQISFLHLNWKRKWSNQELNPWP